MIKKISNYAVKEENSLGRKYKENEDTDRTCFQKDKDRIIHCKAFRRLNEKTQVFIAGSGDHYRTRLTHTLEVAQISRDLARRLGLNEDLCEAIALAHDLGHPPFGHEGEDTLDEILTEFGMHFEHNEQSRRIVEKLEKSYPNFDGLNLTFEVINGLIKHQTFYDQKGKKFEIFPHLEAQIVNIADEIAYTNHDIDDGLRSKIIKLSDLKKLKLWQTGEKDTYKKYGKINDNDIFSARVISSIIALMIADLCKQTLLNIKKYKINTLEDVINHKGALASSSPKMKKMVAEMRKILYSKFYMNPKLRKFVVKGRKMIKELFYFYLKHPEKLTQKKFLSKKDDLITNIKDYLAGMTDSYLISEFEKYIFDL